MTGKPGQKDAGSSPNTGGGPDGSGQSSRRSGSNGDDRDGEGGGAGKKGGGGGESGAPAGKGDGQKGDSQGGIPAPVETEPASSEDDGGSPLVPILIALAVLAAISIGAVVMRRRREDTDPGSPISPNAG
ncbi:MAG TPA: hypothetical protein VFU04_09250 [Solirubrobacterales bacterium]|nr:hypothetical protein [Solirubrobacterales bacterium]